MSNDGHVTNICRLVHQRADFFDGEAGLHMDVSNDDLMLTPKEDVKLMIGFPAFIFGIDRSLPNLLLALYCVVG
jgi:hypothetical protein